MCLSGAGNCSKRCAHAPPPGTLGRRPNQGTYIPTAPTIRKCVNQMKMIQTTEQALEMTATVRLPSGEIVLPGIISVSKGIRIVGYHSEITASDCGTGAGY